MRLAERAMSGEQRKNRHPTHRVARRMWLPLATLLGFAVTPAAAQQASPQPGFDPRQAERQFDARQAEQLRVSRPLLHVPKLSPTEAVADTRKLIDLKAVSVSVADSIPRQQITRVYQPFLGKKVSQADLADIATAIGDLYREAGYHL